MTALLDVLAGTARLSRRDRAALTLAREWVASRPFAAFDALGLGDAVGRELYDVYNHVSGRKADARLALLLRLVLRCDQQRQSDEDWTTPEPAGGSPWRTPVSCSRCGELLTRAYELGQRVLQGPCADALVVRALPLWEQAPATRAR